MFKRDRIPPAATASRTEARDNLVEEAHDRFSQISEGRFPGHSSTSPRVSTYRFQVSLRKSSG